MKQENVKVPVITNSTSGSHEILVNGKAVNVYFFGQNNYSGELNPFTVHPKDITIKELLMTAGIHVNPFIKPNSCEIFCLYGSQMEFDKWYRHAFDCYCTQEAIRRHPDAPIEATEKEAEEIAKSFVPLCIRQ